MEDLKSDMAAVVVVQGVPQRLSYRIPASLPEVSVGSEVLIEVGRRTSTGWVIDALPLSQALEALEVQSEAAPPSSQLGLFQTRAIGRNLKPILSSARVFLPEQLKLFEWMSEYYGVSLAEIIDTAIPRRGAEAKVRCAILTEEFRTKLAVDSSILDALAKKAPQQAALVSTLLEFEEPIPTEFLREEQEREISAPLQALAKKGFVALSEKEAHTLPQRFRKESKVLLPLYSTARHAALTATQQSALTKILEGSASGKFSPFLLFGVTGSGKTEVYLQAIESVLNENKTALVIVPEIALTPQFIDQFQTRLQVPVALLHSQVGTTARWSAWERILSGEVRVAIGARSAVFAPLQDLGLVIVDEEHESSYKQSDALRYNARDVAVMRAKFSKCPVVLGSATPSFETLTNVQRGRYTLLELPERVSTRPLPKIEIVDMCEFRRKDMPSENISPILYEALKETLGRKEQVVVLYNKRGFASFLQCTTCSKVVECPNCSVSLTFHQKKNRLVCHYCSLTISPPSHCPKCRDPKTTQIETNPDGSPLERESVTEKVGRLIQRGSGTERVVEELAALFPEATIVRMDRDTVGKKDAYREILGSMRSGKADILVGTQMIAKGHDLPGVTLVGIIDADVGLHIPDFRSSERSFQLITQAAGRAGRGSEPGRVFVQTREAKHPTIVATSTGRFKAFARYELEFRKKLNYPPLGRLLRLIISSTDRQEALDAAMLVKEVSGKSIEAILAQNESATDEIRMSILGPAPCPHEKLRGRYRWHLLIKSNSSRAVSQLAGAMNQWKGSVADFKDFRLAVDVDPVEML